VPIRASLKESYSLFLRLLKFQSVSFFAYLTPIDFIFTPLNVAQRYRFDDIVTLLNTPRAKLPTPGPSGRVPDTDRSASALLFDSSKE
jgi:hypothetical protein